jgi:hypothetical protein
MSEKYLWLLKGQRNAPGWGDLERDSKADQVNLVIFDRAAWALISAAEPPTQYEGLTPTEPADGLYVSEQGQPIYVVNRKEVSGPGALLRALGDEAIALAERIGDPITAIQKLGRAF